MQLGCQLQNLCLVADLQYDLWQGVKFMPIIVCTVQTMVLKYFRKMLPG